MLTPPHSLRSLFSFLFLSLALLLQASAPLPLPWHFASGGGGGGGGAALLVCADLHLLALVGVILPALFAPRKSSPAASVLHRSSAAISLVLAVGVALTCVAAKEHRDSGFAWATMPSVVVLALSIVWSRGLRRHQEDDYALQEEERPSIKTKAQRWLPAAVYAAVGLLLALVFANVIIDATASDSTRDSQHVWIDFSSPSSVLHRLEAVHDLAIPSNVSRSLRSVPAFRLNIGMEASPLSPRNESKIAWRGGGGSGGGNDSDEDVSPWQGKPTALFFAPLHTATPGRSSSRWLRHMVRRAAEEPRPGSNGTGDGHLALRRAVWFDLPGVGGSDLPRVPASSQRLDVAALALLEGLDRQGLVNWNANASSNDTTLIEQQFSLICLSSGALLCDAFRTYLPEKLLHSHIFIDAETAGSYYGDDVGRDSGLRVGYKAQGHATLAGRIWNDALPALLAPMMPCRLVDGIFGDGGGCPSWALVSPSSLLTALSYRLDASLSTRSPEYANVLSRNDVVKARSRLLGSKPTAVLSSFWKIKRDPQGWGEVQRKQFVEIAMRGGEGDDDDEEDKGKPPPPPPPHRSHLVGWWRVGTAVDGGDSGGVEGLCGAKAAGGRTWCEEAVRKVLAWREASGPGA